jgi:hypothetical protein
MQVKIRTTGQPSNVLIKISPVSELSRVALADELSAGQEKKRRAFGFKTGNTEYRQARHKMAHRLQKEALVGAHADITSTAQLTVVDEERGTGAALLLCKNNSGGKILGCNRSSSERGRGAGAAPWDNLVGFGICACGVRPKRRFGNIWGRAVGG